MTDEPTIPAAGAPVPPVVLEDWVKDTRDRLAAEGPIAAPVVPKPSRFIRRWVLGPLFLAAVWMTWLAWNSTPPGPALPREVRGRFHDIFEHPVPDALVFLAADPAVQTRTGPDGAFCLPGVPLGDQTLVVVQEDIGEEYRVRVGPDSAAEIGDLAYGVPPMSVRRGPGGGADWGKKK